MDVSLGIPAAAAAAEPPSSVETFALAALASAAAAAALLVGGFTAWHLLSLADAGSTVNMPRVKQGTDLSKNGGRWWQGDCGW